jgi:hypothetical protein
MPAEPASRAGNRAIVRAIMTAVRQLAFLLVLVLVPSIVGAQSAFEGFDLKPPCEGTSPPNYGAPGGKPAIAVWSEGDLSRAAWQAAPCLNWAGGKVRMATALGATIAAPSLDELLGRFGALSQYKSIRFWSTMYDHWEEFVGGAGITDGPDARYSYPDLKAADFTAGRSFFYYETGRTGRTIHKLTVRQRTADRVEVATENISPIRYAGFTIFEPRGLQTVTFIERRAPDQWAYFQTIGIGDSSNFLATQSSSPYVNRLAAVYRYMAGMPTDRDPPMAPR